ncbi:hypothetical protein BaRGS_00022621, partial [Batillaria attramentaria]
APWSRNCLSREAVHVIGQSRMTPPKAGQRQNTARVTVLMTGMAVCLLLIFYTANRPFSALQPLLHSTETLFQQAVDLNHQRTEDARRYFQSLPRQSSPSGSLEAPATSTNATKFAIAIVTVSRKGSSQSEALKDVSYVLQSTAALDKLTRDNEMFHGSVLFVCNVDYDPRSHEDADFLKGYVPYVERYGMSSFSLPALRIPVVGHLYNETRHADVIDKERADYMFCVQAAASLNPQYVIVVEDDALPTDNFAPVLEHNLRKLDRKKKCTPRGYSISSCSDHSEPVAWSSSNLVSFFESSSSSEQSETINAPGNKGRDVLQLLDTFSASRNGSHDENNPSFAYLKLSWPSTWQGFTYGFERQVDLFCLSAFGGSMGVLMHVLVTLRIYTSSKALWGRFIVGSFLVFLLCVLIGRQNINQLRTFSKHLYRLQASPDCCTQAMVFPSHVVPSLVTWLAHTPPGSPVDLAMPGFARYYDLATYYIEPNIFRHIGIVSSLSGHSRPPEEYVFS